MDDPQRKAHAGGHDAARDAHVDPDATVIVGDDEAAALIAAGSKPAKPTTLPGGELRGASLPGSALTGNAGDKTKPDDAHPDLPQRQVGRYLMRARIGRGGMAAVYRAHDPSIGRDVAIKFLHAALAEDEECHARFLREARAAGGLSHPNIAVVHDVGEIEGRPFMAMELVEGEPLSDLLDRRRTLSIREAVTIALQIARALDYAHAHGVVHRDIKPGNILMLADGKGVKVTDFGIAHLDDAQSQRTQVGAVLGTPQYMSPEQARGDKLDGRSDIFSAGIVLYQMLGGDRPFRADSMVALATKIANEPHAPLQSKRADVPASLRRVVDRCLAKSPADRYATGAELAEALAKVRRELVEAEQHKTRERIVPLRIRWALAMAAIVALVMGTTAYVITQRQVDAMMQQATDYGASLARFVARQNATAALGDEWEVVDEALKNMMETGNFERLVMIDAKGIVRSSSVPALVGKPYVAAGEALPARLQGGAQAVRYRAGGKSVLGFEAPVTFQNTNVGRIALGIEEEPLTQVARLTRTLMTILALVTVAAVAIATYLLANWFAEPMRLLADSMDEIAKGRFSHRIAETRKDEFGQLFAQFDAMAQALQRRARDGAQSDAVTPSVFGDGTLTQVSPQATPSSTQAAPSSTQAAPSSAQAAPSSAQAAPSSAQAAPSSAQSAPSSAQATSPSAQTTSPSADTTSPPTQATSTTPPASEPSPLLTPAPTQVNPTKIETAQASEASPGLSAPANAAASAAPSRPAESV